MTTSWYLYIIENRLGQLYTGITTDVERRFTEHQADNAKTAKALRGKGPLKLLYSTKVNGHSHALRMERKIKQYSSAQKRRLIAGTLALPDVES